MLWGLCGLMGSGKTLGLVAILNEFFLEGYEIQTFNVHTTFSKDLDIDKIFNFELENCVIGLSEAYTILDSRVNNNAERNIGYFGLQSRKRNVEIVYDAQLMTSVDLRLRFVTDKVIFCQKDWDGEFKLNPETKKKEEIVRGFYYSCYDRGEILTSVKYIPFDVAKEKIFPLYNTYEIAMPLQLQNKNLTLEKVKAIFDDCDTKDSFVSIFKSEYPFTSIQTCKSVFDLLDSGKDKRVCSLLRIKPSPEPIA
jgi:hypothetical protein